MTPWDLIVWSLAAALSLTIVGLGAALGWAFIKAARTL